MGVHISFVRCVDYLAALCTLVGLSIKVAIHFISIAHSVVMYILHNGRCCPTLSCLRCRSTEMDKWTAEQMKTMSVGGNEAARNFFKDKGWTDHQSAKVRTSALLILRTDAVP